MVDIKSERGREAQTLDYILDMLDQLAAMANATGEEDLSLFLRAAVRARRGQDDARDYGRSRLMA